RSCRVVPLRVEGRPSRAQPAPAGGETGERQRERRRLRDLSGRRRLRRRLGWRHLFNQRTVDRVMHFTEAKLEWRPYGRRQVRSWRDREHLPVRERRVAGANRHRAWNLVITGKQGGLYLARIARPPETTRRRWRRDEQVVVGRGQVQSGE